LKSNLRRLADEIATETAETSAASKGDLARLEHVEPVLPSREFMRGLTFSQRMHWEARYGNAPRLPTSERVKIATRVTLFALRPVHVVFFGVGAVLAAVALGLGLTGQWDLLLAVLIASFGVLTALALLTRAFLSVWEMSVFDFYRRPENWDKLESWREHWSYEDETGRTSEDEQ
jgi:hypothetical protein